MIWIATQDALDAALERIAETQTIAVDTEADSLHSYFDKVCLIQISDGREDYLVDPLASLDLTGFGALLADESRTKILHGGDYDLRILQRDFGFRIVNLIDTMVCAQLLGLDGVGLAALLKRHFNVELNKSLQRADWSQRPLPPGMRAYAALDTHYLIELAARLKEELQALGRWEWAIEEFARLEQIRYRDSEDDGESWRRLKGLAKLQRRSLAAVARLHAWRDGMARRMDRPPFKIMGNETILEIAREIPVTKDDLAKIKGVSGYTLSRFGGALLDIAREVSALPESELPQKGETRKWVRDKELEKLLEKLKKVRDEIAAQLGIDPSVLAPKHVLTAIATQRPRSESELAGIPALREWQRRVAGEPLVKALEANT